MEIKRPSLSGPGYGYLGHFTKPAFVKAGHNTAAKVKRPKAKGIKPKIDPGGGGGVDFGGGLFGRGGPDPRDSPFASGGKKPGLTGDKLVKSQVREQEGRGAKLMRWSRERKAAEAAGTPLPTKLLLKRGRKAKRWAMEAGRANYGPRRWE